MPIFVIIYNMLDLMESFVSHKQTDLSRSVASEFYMVNCMGQNSILNRSFPVYLLSVHICDTLCVWIVH